MPIRPVQIFPLSSDDDHEAKWIEDDHQRPAAGVLARLLVEGHDVQEDEDADVSATMTASIDERPSSDQ